MFGFLRPLHASREWRQSYARVCQFQHRMFGLTSLPFLSYEAAFLFQAATDFGLSHPLPGDAVTCCRLRRITNAEQQSDCRLASFAAAFGMVLAGVKLRDDVADSGRWINRLLWWKYRRQAAAAEQWMESQVPGLMATLQDCIHAHSALESRGSVVTLDRYAEPTGRGFAAVFRAAAMNGFMEVTDRTVETMARIGEHIGRAIIAWDCAVDFEQDQIQRQFNPLQRHEDVQDALAVSRLELSQAGWLCPTDSPATNVVQSVILRIQRRSGQAAAVCTPRMLERWGLLPQRGYSYARCDGCEVLCAGAECLQCCVFVPEFGMCSSVDSCGPAGPGCCGRSQTGAGTRNPAEPSQFERFHGRDAVTEGSLTPVGYVTISGEKVPARSASGEFIESDTVVRVVRTDPFGVTVRPSNAPS